MQDFSDHQHELPVAPDWSLALGVCGRALVFLGIAFFLAAIIGWLFAPKTKWGRTVGGWGFTLGSVSLFGVFAVLATLFVAQRFEYPYVFGHNDLLNPVAYRIAGVWAGQEGSFLLWAVCSAVFGLLTMKGSGIYRRWYTVLYALFQAALCGIIAYESPFNIMATDGKFLVPPDGVGLSPALQNYWVIIHPPTIFLGFGSLTALFCYAASALISKQVVDWAKMVRPWALVSLTLVGVGLCMGGLWAYETLGWGGFWKWDPVENTSFVPFVLGAIFIHGLIVQINRGKWVISNLLLGALPFLSFVYGTFLTRSGLLGDTSVHSFAEMQKGALWLLLGLGTLSIVGFGALWTVRAFELRREFTASEDVRPGMTREGAYRWASILMFGLALAAGFGMSVPMVSGVSKEFGGQASVGKWWMLGIALLSAIAYFVLRARSQAAEKSGGPSKPMSYWISVPLGLGMVIGAFGAITAFMAPSLGDRMKVIEEWQYHQIVPWFVFPILVLMAASPFVAWGGVGMKRLLGRLYGPACVSFGLTGLTLLALMYSPWGKLGVFEDKIPLFFTGQRPEGQRIEVSSLTWTLILAGFCYFVIVMSLWTIGERWKHSKKEAIAIWTMHIGVGVMLAGLVLSRGLERKEQVLLQANKPAYAMGYKLTYEGITADLADRRNKVKLHIEPTPLLTAQGRSGLAGFMDKTLGGLDTRKAFDARPGLYYVQDSMGNSNPMNWPHIQHGLLNDMYLALGGIQTDATEPHSLQKGKALRFKDYVITYKGMTREGQPGQEGTKFGAQLSVHNIATGEMRDLNPKMKITSAGPVEEPADLDEDYKVTLAGMNASDQSANIVIGFSSAVFPIEFFYKPFTSLVWIGLGILAAGGFLAAWHRRVRPVAPGAKAKAEPEGVAEPNADALAPTA